MVRAVLLLFVAACAPLTMQRSDQVGGVVAVELRTEGQVDPLGLDGATAHLSWRLRGSDVARPQAWQQTAYHVVAARSEAQLERAPDVCDSGEVETPWGPNVRLDVRSLAPGERCVWRVRVRDGDRRWSAWSAVASFVQGPRTEADWPGPWIGGTPDATPWDATWIWHPQAGAAVPSPGTCMFRGTLELPVLPAGAITMYAHADDHLVVWVNGREVVRGGSWDQALAIDVTQFVCPGRNVVAVAATNTGTSPNPAGLALALIASASTSDAVQLATDLQWRVREAASAGWHEPDADDATWDAPRTIVPQPEWRDAIASVTRRPDPQVRRAFELSELPLRAVVHVASVGYHALALNGSRVGDRELAPNVSDLRTRARFSSYEVTDALRVGTNVLGIELGRGWAQHATYGRDGRVLARVRVDLFGVDGTHRMLGTDTGWQARAGARTLLGAWRFRNFGGERIDAARAGEAWCTPGAAEDAAGWAPATAMTLTLPITADGCAPSRRGPALAAQSIEEARDGTQRVDFGLACTGLVQARLRGAPHARITLRVAERPEEATTYAQVSQLVLDASGAGTFTHRFNYAAGRWLTVEGAAPMAADDVCIWPVATELQATTEFACSHALLNAIWATAKWTLRNLTLGGYIVDCPHRERLGYGGDAHATLGTMLATHDAEAFYRKWLQDWRDVQRPDGDVPHTAPTVDGGGGPAWGGILVMLPWALYVETGDVDVLATNFAPMQRWVEFLTSQTRDGLLVRYGDPVWGFAGDWVPPGFGQEPGTRVPDEWTLLFNNCYWLDTLATMACIAGALGHDGAAADYRTRAATTRAAMRTRFFDGERQAWTTSAQPYLALLLRTGLVAGDERARVEQNLVDAVAATKGHIDAGIHGTAYVLAQLTAQRRDDLVYGMMTKTDYPSWGHMLAQGATTLWEQWDGEHSRLHSSFVSVGAWFVRSLAGIRADPEFPGYEQFTVAPAVVGGLAWVRCRHTCARGTIASAWRIDGDDVVFEISVPPSCRARLVLPTATPDVLDLDGQRVAVRAVDAARAEVIVGPGRHRVRAPRTQR